MHEHITFNKSAIEGILNDAISGFIGFSIGSVYSMIWIYKAREYIRDRLRAEKEIGFSRRQFLTHHREDLLTDYKNLNQYDPNLTSDEDLEDLRKLNTEDPAKLEALRKVHKDLHENTNEPLEDVVEIKKLKSKGN